MVPKAAASHNNNETVSPICPASCNNNLHNIEKQKASTSLASALSKKLLA